MDKKEYNAEPITFIINVVLAMYTIILAWFTKDWIILISAIFFTSIIILRIYWLKKMELKDG